MPTRQIKQVKGIKFKRSDEEGQEYWSTSKGRIVYDVLHVKSQPYWWVMRHENGGVIPLNKFPGIQEDPPWPSSYPGPLFSEEHKLENEDYWMERLAEYINAGEVAQ